MSYVKYLVKSYQQQEIRNIAEWKFKNDNLKD